MPLYEPGSNVHKSEQHIVVDVNPIESGNSDEGQVENINVVNIDINQAENNEINTP